MTELQIVQTCGWHLENTISYWDDELSIEYLESTRFWNWHRFYELGYILIPGDNITAYALACSLPN